MRRFVVGSVVAATASLIGVGSTLAYLRFLGERTTTTRLSPDESIRARLVEIVPGWAIDRNFALRLEHRTDGRVVALLPSSEDQGRPEGTERLIWSKDGNYLLLVGRHFYVKDDLFLDNGDQAYFLHHLPTGRTWINSAEPSTFLPLAAEHLQQIEFTEPVTLKPR